VIAPRMEVSIEGLDQLEQRLTEKLAAVMPQTTVFEVKAGGARGGAKNGTIARALAAHGRNFFWGNKKTVGAIAFAARGLFGTAAERRRAEQTISAQLLIGIGENLQAQKNPNGASFTQLSARYAAEKRRKFGRVVPIGRASGDLIGGLKVEVRRT
jgi:hypothetical protein